MNKNAVEEARFFIDLVEKDKDLENNTVKLEMLGNFYIIPNMSKLDSDHLNTAMEKFKGAISIDQNSDVAHFGYAKCLLIEFKNTKSKKRHTNLLDNALSTIEKIKQPTFKQDMLKVQFKHEFVIFLKLINK